MPAAVHPISIQQEKQMIILRDRKTRHSTLQSLKRLARLVKDVDALKRKVRAAEAEKRATSPRQETYRRDRGAASRHDRAAVTTRTFDRTYW
jgi:hypothetical protein